MLAYLTSHVRSLTLLPLLTVFTVASQAVGQTETSWIGNDPGNNTWSTNANWSSGVAPDNTEPTAAANGLIVFDSNLTNVLTSIRDADRRVFGLEFRGTETFIINQNGGVLYIGDGGVTVQGGGARISTDVRFRGESGTINVVNNSTGLLDFNNDIMLHRLSGNSPTDLVFGGSGDIEVNRFTRRVSGYDMNLVKNGTGTLTILNANLTDAGTNAAGAITGSTTINQGKIRINDERSIGGNPTAFNAGHLTLDGGTLGAFGTFTIDDVNRGLTLGASGGTFDVEDANILTIANVITGAGNLTKTGTGTLVLGAVNTYTGTTTVAAGILQNGIAEALPATLLTVGLDDTAATYDLNGFNQTIGGLQAAGADLTNKLVTNTSATLAALTVNSTGTLTYGGIISGNLDLTKTGTGRLILTGDNSYTGVTTVSGGVLEVRHDNALGTTDGNTVVNSATGILTFRGGITVAEDIVVVGGVNSPRAIINEADTNTLTGLLNIGTGLRLGGTSGTTLNITGGVTGTGGSPFFVFNPGGGTINITDNPILLGSSGRFYHDQSGVVMLGVAGNEFGQTLVAGGILRMGVDNALPATTSSIQIGISYSRAGFLDLNGFDQTAIELRSGTFSRLGNPTRNITSADAATLTLNQTVNSVYDGTITGQVSLVKNGTGRLELTGANTHSGDTVVNAGTLRLHRVAATSGVAGNISSANTGSATITGLASTANLVIGQPVTGTGIPAGAFVSGITDGTTIVIGYPTAIAPALGAVADLGFGALDGSLGGSTVDYQGGAIEFGNATTAMDFGGLEGTQNLSLNNLGGGAVALTVGANDESTSYSGVLSGLGSITKVGTGTWTLSGDHTYTGSTTVNGGLMEVNGSLNNSSVVTVGVDGGIGGLGTVGNATINGILSPGSGSTRGVFTINGDLDLTGTARSIFDLGAVADTNDLVDVNGNLDLNGLLGVRNAGGFENGTYLLFTSNAPRSGAGDGTFIFSEAPAGFNLEVRTVGNEVFLDVNQAGLQYWDGAGTSPNLMVDGGDGTWDLSTTNWTNENGNANTGWQNDGTMTAVFKDAGAGGTVTLDDTINAAGLQFGTDGYTITGTGGFTVSSGNSLELLIDPGLSATVDVGISGDGGVMKTGSGTIILSGDNDYAGNTEVLAGALQFDTDLASLTGDILNGSLVVFNPATAGDTFSFSQTISGIGNVSKIGDGTMDLTGATLSHTGLTDVSGGTLLTGDLAGSLQVSTGGSYSPGAIGTAQVVNVGDQLNLNGGDLLWDLGADSSSSDQLIVTNGAFLSDNTLFNFNDLGAQNGNYLLIDGLSGIWDLNMLSAAGLTDLVQGTFLISGDELYFSAYFGGLISGPVLQNSAPVGTPTMADFLVSGQVTTGTPAESNTINSLVFDPFSRLQVFNDLTVTSGNFTTRGARAVIQGGRILVPTDFHKYGPGTLDVRSNVVVDGKAFVHTGALAVNGVFETQLLHVLPNGTLMGSGLIIGDVYNGGTVAPGNSIGTLTIDGNYTQSGGGTLQIEVSSVNHHDILSVTGVARLDGELEIQSWKGYKPKYGDQIPFLRAGRGIIGTFDEITMPNPARQRGRFLNGGTVGTLLVAPASYTLVAETPNQKRVAGALDKWIGIEDGDIGEVTLALDLLKEEQYPAAFEAIQPTYHAGAIETAVELSQGHGQILHQQLSARRLGERAARQRQNITENNRSMGERSGKQVASLGAKSGKAQTLDSPLAPPQDDTRWNAWTQGSGLFSSGGLSLTPGEDFESGTFMAGADYALSESVSVGFFASYQEGWGDYDNGGDMDFEATRFGLYTTVDHGGFYAHAAVGAGTVGADIKRPVRWATMDRTARSEPDGYELFALVGAGYDFQKGNWTFGPQISVQYTRVDFGTYDERGAGSLNLRMRDADSDSLRSWIGGRVAYTIAVSEKVSLIPELRAFWQHEFLDGDALSTSLNNDNGPGFVYEIEREDKDALFLGAGLGLQVGTNFFASLYYNVDLGRNDDANHIISVNANWKF